MNFWWSKIENFAITNCECLYWDQNPYTQNSFKSDWYVCFRFQTKILQGTIDLALYLTFDNGCVSVNTSNTLSHVWAETTF